MALVCPVGHPPGEGTSFCRLCGRAYVETVDVPAQGALALIAVPPPEAVADVTRPVPAAPLVPVRAPLTPPPPSAASASAPAPPPALPPPAPLAGTLRLPLVEVPAPPGAAVPAAPPAAVPVPPHAPPVADPPAPPSVEVPADAPAPDTPAPSRVDRATVFVATAAGFVGGLVSGAGVTYLLG